jgi:hypothetical protein
MKTVLLMVFTCCFCTVTSIPAAEQRSDLGNVTGGITTQAQAIIEKKCTVCHSKDKIDIALSSGRNMSLIQKQMVRKGARLNSNEREVLGIFWKQSQPITRK